ncbi:MAG: M48 family metallopeptidase [Candidatus Accumulibacter propinquus]|jgi:predicted metal-dependent hydrolase|uniref:M48 family metallopeptidase n=1 Tax=Candidatus Accumulibacter propinquus TaxID=2954380 RepID=UPI002FC3D76E
MAGSPPSGTATYRRWRADTAARQPDHRSPGHRRQALRLEPANAERALTLCLRSPAEAPLLLEKALRERASTLFVERLGHYASRLGVALPRLSLSSARTRWGSCSLRSGIRLNWRLIHFPLPVIDYVAVHELAHLREMNHSARFWSIVAQVYPDYPNARKALQLGATHCPHW